MVHLKHKRSGVSFLSTVLMHIRRSGNIAGSILSFPHSVSILPRMQLMTLWIQSRPPCSSRTFITCFQGQDLIHKVSLASILAINKAAKIRRRGLFFISFYPVTHLPALLLRDLLHSSSTLRCLIAAGTDKAVFLPPTPCLFSTPLEICCS